MNESTERLLAKLEQATSAEKAEGVDDETTLLGECWMAFGKLLDAADEESEELLVVPRQTRRTGLTLRVFATLAASSLIALAAWSILNRGSDSIDRGPDIATPNELPRPGSDINDIAGAPNTDAAISVVDEFAWEDSFDEQLAATSQAIRSVQADWSGDERRYSVLLDQFEQFNDELSKGSL